MGSHYDEQQSKHYRESIKHEVTDDELGFVFSIGDTPKQHVFPTGGRKDISGKPRFDLIPPEALLSLAEVYSLGVQKYEDRNWEKGIPFSTALGALKRHLNSFELGNMINTTDGNQEHIAHVMWWAVALVTFIKRGRDDLNDLPHYQKGFKNEK